MKKILSVISIVLLLSSCGSVYEDKYTFIPPKGEEERICANQCVIERTQCSQQCTDKGSIMALGNRIISAVDGVDNAASKDSKECDNICRETHSICHKNCGGQVIVEKVCVQFCKNKKE